MHLANPRLLFYELFSPFGPGPQVIMAWDEQLRGVRLSPTRTNVITCLPVEEYYF